MVCAVFSSQCGSCLLNASASGNLTAVDLPPLRAARLGGARNSYHDAGTRLDNKAKMGSVEESIPGLEAIREDSVPLLVSFRFPLCDFCFVPCPSHSHLTFWIWEFGVLVARCD
jgi:hypothetical protein